MSVDRDSGADRDLLSCCFILLWILREYLDHCLDWFVSCGRVGSDVAIVSPYLQYERWYSIQEVIIDEAMEGMDYAVDMCQRSADCMFCKIIPVKPVELRFHISPHKFEKLGKRKATFCSNGLALWETEFLHRQWTHQLLRGFKSTVGHCMLYEHWAVRNSL